MDKTTLRRWVQAKKRAMTQLEVETRSTRLAELFFQTDAYRNAQTVYGYLSYNQEVRTIPILEQTLRDGKQIAVPKVFGKEMKFLRMENLSLVKTGYAGIPEPIADGPVACDPSALVLMPGLAFDFQGHRIGYGGGFYDRFLAAEPNHPTVALCYEFQLLPALETDPYDVPVDLVLWA